MRTMILLVAASVALCPLAANADAIQFKDGRYFDVSKIVKTKGGYTLKYAAGEIFVRDALVELVLMKDAGGKYVPKNDQEKAKFAKGLVPWKGKWISKSRRDEELAKKAKAAKKAMAEAKKHQKWRDRYIQETRHFKFEYTIPPSKAKEYMVLMEKYYATFMKKWRIRVPRKQPKLKVCFYHDSAYYYQVSGAPRGAIGYFRFVDPIELNFYYDANDERLTLDVMFHEANHYLTYLINPKFNYPAWVNESLAEYYGASHWDPGKKKVTVGNLQEGRLVVLMDAIKGDKWQGLEDMIKLGRFSATHYAWGWSFIHFLMSNKRYSSRFQRFYIALGTGKGIKRVPYQGDMKQCKPEEVIRGLKAYLGVKDLKQLEKQWHAYVKKQKLKTHRGYEDAAQWAERWGLTIRAGRYYRTAIEKGTKNPLTFDNYGEWLVSKNRPAEAVKKFEKAIELDPMNAYFHLHLGRALISTGDAAGGKKRKKLALELAPNDAWLEYMAR